MNDTGDSDSYGNVSRNIRGCFPGVVAMIAMLMCLLMW